MPSLRHPKLEQLATATKANSKIGCMINELVNPRTELDQLVLVVNLQPLFIRIFARLQFGNNLINNCFFVV